MVKRNMVLFHYFAQSDTFVADDLKQFDYDCKILSRT